MPGCSSRGPSPVIPCASCPSSSRRRARRSRSSCDGSKTARPAQSDARQWVKDEKAKAPLAIDWVFAGSELYEDPATKKQVYAADEGDLITVANFGSAILDLPIASSADDADRVFVTNTEKIPPLGTEVFVALGPRPAKANEKPGPGDDAATRNDRWIDVTRAGLPDGNRPRSDRSSEAHTRPQPGETAHPTEVSPCSPIRPVSRRGASRDIR